ncbi:hypothetical protein M409DRAFT_65551 [Zasmidium cellare ATCC 36951]|uniref:D-xylulose reductase n=1 Tax=Zasmidium cellare ATCC 36951 TaxID=1080233 RepID=A0A6A6CT82_ZASCE|nr:uncharacterized protein M409DRAFT_65551 [Zasmidium cellare ATCC 36951]KAF2168686.1 hypothetical protein M409DRAFT_65551 [Zasmidium cellare ATCC 36951]
MDPDHHNLSFVLNKPGDVTYEHRTIPQLGPYDALVHVHYTGICGSDVHYWKHGRIGNYVVNDPMVLGHESSGIVVSVGSNVTSLAIGDRVAMEPGIPCRRCTRCRGGKYNLCPHVKFAATPPVDGTLTKSYALPEDFCHRLADHISLQEGALVEPLSVAIHIVRQAKIKPGQSIVIFGAGPIGLLCCAVAKVFGAVDIVCADLSESRLNFAKSYAATQTYLTRQQTAEAAAADILRTCGLSEDGVDVAIDATGAEPCIQTSVHLLRTGGTYVQAGMGKSEVVFPIGALCGKEITVKGSFRYQEGDYGLAVEMLAKSRLSVKELVTNVVGFDEAETAFWNVSTGKGIKTLIKGVDVVDGPT